MALALADQVGFCRIDERVIFLDIVRDRYFGTKCPVTSRLEDGFPPAIVSMLLRQGLLIEHPGGCVRPLPLPPQRASSSISDDLEATPVRGLAAGAMFAMLATTIDLRRRPLSKVLDDVRDRRAVAPAPSAPTMELDRLVASFRSARRWMPLVGRCLPDSLALMRFLIRHGHRPTLVFGVIAYPFAAHCWLQAGDRILNDVFDHAQRFTPIYEV